MKRSAPLTGPGSLPLLLATFRPLLVVALVGWGTSTLRGTGAAAEDAGAPVDPAKAHVPLDEIPRALALVRQAPLDLAEQPEVRAHYEAARARFKDDDYDRAVAELDAALSAADGDSFEVLYLLAVAKQRLGRLGEARLAAEFAGLVRPDDPDVHYLLGGLYREQGRLEAAAGHFRTATLAADQQPENPRVTAAWYELGECLRSTGYLEAAIEAFANFDRALAARPEHRTADDVAQLVRQYPHGLIEARLDLLKRLHEPARMVQVAAAALEEHPDDPYLQRLYVRTLLDDGRAADAFRFCRARLEAVGTGGTTVAPDASGGVLLSLAIDAAHASGEFDAWVRELEAALGRGEQLDFTLRLARRLTQRGDHELAVPVWRALAQTRPQDTETAWALAGALRQSGDLPGALQSLIQFVRQNPDNADLSPARLEAWMRSFEATDEFLRLVSDAVGRDDCDFATYVVLGLTAAAARQTELADRLFTAAAQARPESALVKVAWGRMRVAEYRWADALQLAEDALTRVPDLAAAHVLRGEALAGMDDNAAAEQAYRAALERCPNDADYLVALARHCRRTGEYLAAQRYFQQAWAVDHTRADAIEELVDLYLGAGKADLARAAVKEAEAADVGPDVLRRIQTPLRFFDAPLGPEHIAELARQMEEHPDDVITGLNLAAGYYIRNQDDQALALLDRLAPQGTDAERAMFLRARLYLRRLEPGRAIDLLNELVRRYPRRTAPLSLLAQACLSDFRLEEGRAALQRALTANLDDEERREYRTDLLSSYLDVLEYDGALKLLDEWLAADPSNDQWNKARLGVLLAADRTAEAVELATSRLDSATQHHDELLEQYKATGERLRQKPDDTDAQVQRQRLERELTAATEELTTRREQYVSVCQSADQGAAAERAVRGWLAATPGDPDIQEWLIDLTLANKRATDALEVIAQYVPKSPADVVKVLTWRARAYVAADRLEDALRDLGMLLDEPFVRGSPAVRAAVRQETVRLLLSVNEFTRALRLCDGWLGENPDDPATQYEVLTIKRGALQRADREDEQLPISERLLALRPHDPGLNNDVGYTWADRGVNLDRALQMIRVALSAEPLNPAYLDSMGWVQYKRGDFVVAREYLSRAVRLRNGQDPVVFDHLGDAEFRLGDVAAARRNWEKAVQLLTEARPEELVSRQVALLAALRAKLAEPGATSRPAVAPTAVEQQGKGNP